MLQSAASRCIAVLFITILMTAAWAESGFAQRSFGISYTPPENAGRFHNDLKYLKNQGIHSLLIEEVIESDKMAVIEESGFDVYVSVPVTFPTIWTLEQEGDDLISEWSRYIEFYRKFDNIKGFGLFSFGQTHSLRFREFFEVLISEIDRITDIPLFYTSSNADDSDFAGLFDYRIYHAADTSAISNLASFESIGGIAYSTGNRQFDIRMFQYMINQVRDIGQVPIFLDWEWFVYNRSSDELIEEVIQSYAVDDNALFANPRALPEEASSNWLILILLIIWGSFVIHYSLMPTYRKALIRFFDNHKFLMNDVMHRVLRVGQSNILILIQQGLLGGLFLLALTKYTLSSVGFEALVYHLQLVYPYTPNYFVIFLIGFSFSILINVVCTGWLYLVNNNIRHFSQAAIFQLWPQHLNLFVITLLIALILSGSSIILVNITALTFLTIFFGSFLFSAFDAGNHTVTRFYYYPLTAAIYGVLLINFLIWVYFATGFVEFWDLATSLK
ncbi:MAG: hypothetical protein WD038_02545 [Balneolales bacterium]